MAEQSWAQVLEGAARRDEASLLRLTRHVTQLLARYGAYAVRDDWTTLAREIAEEAPKSFSGRSDAGGHIESVAKNRFWGKVLDLMTESDPKASALFFPTVRKLLATWDGSRAQEAVWDDIVSETSIQIWERWRARDVEKPWALLCTIAKRRFLDRVRATRPTDELDQEMVEDERDASPGEGVFTQQALGVLDEQEREIVVRMDLEGETRIEIANSMGVSEGQAAEDLAMDRRRTPPGAKGGLGGDVQGLETPEPRAGGPEARARARRGVRRALPGSSADGARMNRALSSRSGDPRRPLRRLRCAGVRHSTRRTTSRRGMRNAG